MPSTEEQDLVELNASILNSVKEQCGIPAIRTEFDQVIQLDINTAFSILHQLGVGPEEPFIITSADDTWEQFITQENMEMVKTFVALKVRQLFDPPSGAAAEAITKVLDELTFRLNVAVNQNAKRYE